MNIKEKHYIANCYIDFFNKHVFVSTEQFPENKIINRSAIEHLATMFEFKEDKGFNYTKASNLLGISRGTLYNWLETSANGFAKRTKKLITKEELYRYYLSTLKKKNSSNPLPPHLKKKK